MQAQIVLSVKPQMQQMCRYISDTLFKIEILENPFIFQENDYI